MRRPCRSERVDAAHFGDDGVEGVGVGADRAGQGVAAERAEAYPRHQRYLPRQKRQAFVVDHDQRAAALNDRALLGEIERYNRHILRPDVLPDVELGPIRQREHPHRLAGLDPCVEQPPQLGTLIAWIPSVIGRAMRENALLGPALFLVAPRPAEGGVETAICPRPGARPRSSSLACGPPSRRRPAKRRRRARFR